MRVLTEKENKYTHNAWDEVKIPEEYISQARQKISRDIACEKPTYEITYEPWDAFYKRYNRSFFKERQWIAKEHPELIVHSNTILEIGCGTGSTLVPLIKARLDRSNDYLQSTQRPKNAKESSSLSKACKDGARETDSSAITISDSDMVKCKNIYGVDYSSTAIELLRAQAPQLALQFVQSDVTKTSKGFVFNGKVLKSVNIILLIYTLSAVHPSAYPSVFNVMHRTLGSGGIVIFKDYYEMDLTQLRFKESQALAKNLYIRGDSTYVYYFTREEIEKQTSGLFKIVKYKENRKLIVNRKKKKEMYRFFVEIKLEKL